MIIKVVLEKMGERLQQLLTKGQSTYEKELNLLSQQVNAINHP